MAVAPAPNEEQVRAALARVLASGEFQGSDRLCRFLRFTVDSRLRGQQEHIKEYLIGREVFDRNGDYDPRIDPIVRVEARRLRKKLDEYYAGAGASDPVRIDFPKGSYVPVFAEPAATPPGTAPDATCATTSTRRSWLVPALGGTALAVAAGAYLVTRSGIGRPSETVVVIPARWVWKNERDFPNVLHDEDIAERVAAELARKDNIRVIAWPSIQKYRTATAEARQIAAEMGATRALIVTVRVESTGYRATAFFIDPKLERKLGVWDRSGLDLASVDSRAKAAVELAEAVASLPARK